MKFSTVVYPCNSDLTERVSDAVRALCKSRKVAKGLGPGRVQLTPELTELLAAMMVEAATHAASREIPDRAARAGAPADNARIILIDDICRACKSLGLPPGWRYVDPQSVAVELFVIVASLIWPSPCGSSWNPRKTFERTKGAAIVRN
jgi:hypothetical protein